MWTTFVVKSAPATRSRRSPTRFSKAVADLKPVPVFYGRPVSTSDEVDAITRARLRERYFQEDELKLHRQRFAGPSDEWTAYDTFVGDLLKEA